MSRYPAIHAGVKRISIRQTRSFRWLARGCPNPMRRFDGRPGGVSLHQPLMKEKRVVWLLPITPPIIAFLIPLRLWPTRYTIQIDLQVRSSVWMFWESRWSNYRSGERENEID
uniref:Uncharacterized protein n=1 Tax=Kalanchoe fedtschenkoi TaxID=63787 RepID=A0A7N0SYU7_KALFE